MVGTFPQNMFYPAGRPGVPCRLMIRCFLGGNLLSWLERVEDGHADGDAVFDLLVDEGEGVVHDGIAELDAAIDGAGVHDVDAGIGNAFEAFLGDSIDAVVFAQAGEILDILTLHLHA